MIKRIPMSESDPRIFFAAERTLLAWIRTGLAVIGLGFVVSRFGLFVRLMANQNREIALGSHYSVSGVLGIAFVLMGSTSIIIAAIQHHRFVSTLPDQDIPNTCAKNFGIFHSIAIGTLGVGLAGYLLVTR